MDRINIREKAWQYLAMSLAIDFLSVANLGLPLIGEVSDAHPITLIKLCTS